MKTKKCNFFTNKQIVRNLKVSEALSNYNQITENFNFLPKAFLSNIPEDEVKAQNTLFTPRDIIEQSTDEDKQETFASNKSNPYFNHKTYKEKFKYSKHKSLEETNKTEAIDDADVDELIEYTAIQTSSLIPKISNNSSCNVKNPLIITYIVDIDFGNLENAQQNESISNEHTDISNYLQDDSVNKDKQCTIPRIKSTNSSDIDIKNSVYPSKESHHFALDHNNDQSLINNLLENQDDQTYAPGSLYATPSNEETGKNFYTDQGNDLKNEAIYTPLGSELLKHCDQNQYLGEIKALSSEFEQHENFDSNYQPQILPYGACSDFKAAKTLTIPQILIESPPISSLPYPDDSPSTKAKTMTRYSISTCTTSNYEQHRDYSPNPYSINEDFQNSPENLSSNNNITTILSNYTQSIDSLKNMNKDLIEKNINPAKNIPINDLSKFKLQCQSHIINSIYSPTLPHLSRTRVLKKRYIKPMDLWEIRTDIAHSTSVNSLANTDSVLFHLSNSMEDKAFGLYETYTEYFISLLICLTQGKVNKFLELQTIDDIRTPRKFFDFSGDSSTYCLHWKCDAPNISAEHKIPIILGEIAGEIIPFQENKMEHLTFQLDFSPEAILYRDNECPINLDSIPSLQYKGQFILDTSQFKNQMSYITHYKFPKYFPHNNYEVNCQLHQVMVNGWPHIIVTSIPGVQICSNDYLFADFGEEYYRRYFANSMHNIYSEVLYYRQLYSSKRDNEEILKFSKKQDHSFEYFNRCQMCKKGIDNLGEKRLIMCDGCFCAYHLNCIGLDSSFLHTEQNGWFCSHCETIADKIYTFRKYPQKLVAKRPIVLNDSLEASKWSYSTNENQYHVSISFDNNLLANKQSTILNEAEIHQTTQTNDKNIDNQVNFPRLTQQSLSFINGFIKPCFGCYRRFKNKPIAAAICRLYFLHTLPSYNQRVATDYSTNTQIILQNVTDALLNSVYSHEVCERNLSIYKNKLNQVLEILRLEPNKIIDIFKPPNSEKHDQNKDLSAHLCGSDERICRDVDHLNLSIDKIRNNEIEGNENIDTIESGSEISHSSNNCEYWCLEAEKLKPWCKGVYWSKEQLGWITQVWNEETEEKFQCIQPNEKLTLHASYNMAIKAHEESSKERVLKLVGSLPHYGCVRFVPETFCFEARHRNQTVTFNVLELGLRNAFNRATLWKSKKNNKRAFSIKESPKLPNKELKKKQKLGESPRDQLTVSIGCDRDKSCCYRLNDNKILNIKQNTEISNKNSKSKSKTNFEQTTSKNNLSNKKTIKNEIIKDKKCKIKSSKKSLKTEITLSEEADLLMPYLDGVSWSKYSNSWIVRYLCPKSHLIRHKRFLPNNTGSMKSAYLAACEFAQSEPIKGNLRPSKPKLDDEGTLRNDIETLKPIKTVNSETLQIEKLSPEEKVEYFTKQAIEIYPGCMSDPVLSWITTPQCGWKVSLCDAGVKSIKTFYISRYQNNVATALRKASWYAEYDVSRKIYSPIQARNQADNNKLFHSIYSFENIKSETIKTDDVNSLIEGENPSKPLTTENLPNSVSEYQIYNSITADDALNTAFACNISHEPKTVMKDSSLDIHENYDVIPSTTKMSSFKPQDEISKLRTTKRTYLIDSNNETKVEESIDNNPTDTKRKSTIDDIPSNNIREQTIKNKTQEHEKLKQYNNEIYNKMRGVNIQSESRQCSKTNENTQNINNNSDCYHPMVDVETQVSDCQMSMDGQLFDSYNNTSQNNETKIRLNNVPTGSQKNANTHKNLSITPSNDKSSRYDDVGLIFRRYATGQPTHPNLDWIDGDVNSVGYWVAEIANIKKRFKVSLYKRPAVAVREAYLLAIEWINQSKTSSTIDSNFSKSNKKKSEKKYNALNKETFNTNEEDLLAKIKFDKNLEQSNKIHAKNFIKHTKETNNKDKLLKSSKLDKLEINSKTIESQFQITMPSKVGNSTKEYHRQLEELSKVFVDGKYITYESHKTTLVGTFQGKKKYSGVVKRGFAEAFKRVYDFLNDAISSIPVKDQPQDLIEILQYFASNNNKKDARINKTPDIDHDNETDIVKADYVNWSPSSQKSIISGTPCQSHMLSNTVSETTGHTSPLNAIETSKQVIDETHSGVQSKMVKSLLNTPKQNPLFFDTPKESVIALNIPEKSNPPSNNANLVMAKSSLLHNAKKYIESDKFHVKKAKHQTQIIEKKIVPKERLQIQNKNANEQALIQPLNHSKIFKGSLAIPLIPNDFHKSATKENFSGKSSPNLSSKTWSGSSLSSSCSLSSDTEDLSSLCSLNSLSDFSVSGKKQLPKTKNRDVSREITYNDNFTYNLEDQANLITSIAKERREVMKGISMAE